MLNQQSQSIKPKTTIFSLLSLLTLIIFLSGCMRATESDDASVIVVTATFLPSTTVYTLSPPQPLNLSPVPSSIITPTPDPTHPFQPQTDNQQYVVQPGDTLYNIAIANNLSLETLLAANELVNPDLLKVGQVITIPGAPAATSPNQKLFADANFVRGPAAAQFDIANFIASMPGYIRLATDTVATTRPDGSQREDLLNSAQIIERVSREYSIDPRILLALLEYRASWLSNPVPSEPLKTHPIIPAEAPTAVSTDGFYRQLIWVANELNRAYYGWKYRGWQALELAKGVRYRIAPELNAATVAIQYLFSINSTPEIWLQAISLSGFYSTYYAYFGDPLTTSYDPLVPSGLTQPPMTLPFSSGEAWYFTGGPHGGWGGGSAWAAIDFTPPDERPDNAPLCYISQHWTTAIAPGIIARSENGVVVLDLDGDGNEGTGWTILYLHIASSESVAQGTIVNTGDKIGHPSCEGGVSTATHLHIARRYNGEWIPANCATCPPHHLRPPFVLSGWRVLGFNNQVYQGSLQKETEQRIADQGRENPLNQISW